MTDIEKDYAEYLADIALMVTADNATDRETGQRLQEMEYGKKRPSNLKSATFLDWHEYFGNGGKPASDAESAIEWLVDAENNYRVGDGSLMELPLLCNFVHEHENGQGTAYITLGCYTLSLYRDRGEFLFSRFTLVVGGVSFFAFTLDTLIQAMQAHQLADQKPAVSATEAELMEAIKAKRIQINNAVNDHNFGRKMLEGGELPRVVQKFLTALDVMGYTINKVKQ